MSICHACPTCGTNNMRVFYEIRNVPVHSVLLFPTQKEAINYPKGNISLGFCPSCGFISNVVFDPTLHEYSPRYEATQAYSPIFNNFHRKLAIHLIKKYNLHNKNIIEIGCGQGEFLTLLCELGDNHGVGFDPAYNSEHVKNPSNNRITFIKDFYSEKYQDYQGDFICCKMTLEHIQKTADFVKTIRNSINDKSETVVFFQVPNVRRILRDLAFWDIYYEHCSYFSLGSLSHLFQNCSFKVIDLWKDYDDQYLMIAAKPSNDKKNPILAQEEDLTNLAQEIDFFAENYQHRIRTWQGNLQTLKQNKKRVVIWGAGSKGVAFLTTLGVQDTIKYAVDIDPYKNGMYMAGTGQQIVSPEFLKEYKPDVVIVMNPIYFNEIRQYLGRMEVSTKLMPVG